MRKLTRWTLNALTVLSLLLSVAAAALWARSYSSADAPGFVRGSYAVWFLSARGHVALWWIDASTAPGS